MPNEVRQVVPEGGMALSYDVIYLQLPADTQSGMSHLLMLKL